MKTLRNISTVIAFAFILAGISGCSGCNPPPEPASFSPTEGPETGGTTIRIMGDKFDMKNGVTVKIGGKNATSVNVPSKMEITAMTPAGMAGESVSVVVTNNGNTKPEGTVTMSQQFTYTDATAPTITAVSPAAGTVISEYEDSLSVSVPISITFSEDVDSTSGSLTVSVKSTPDSATEQSGEIAGTVSGSGNTMTFTPNEPYRSGRKYTVNISGVKDTAAAGNTLAEARSFSFTITLPEKVDRYLVKEGDTLPIIASRPEVYDNEELWPRLAEANQDDYDFDRRRLHPGRQWLWVPRGSAWGD
jgi:nucleoid-associated protein YgaU